MSKEERHYLKPLKNGGKMGSHMLLFVDAIRKGADLVAGERQAAIVLGELKAPQVQALDLDNGDDWADRAIESAMRQKGPLTVWLYRGWQDLVLTGLADLIDRGIITYRYCNLDGKKLLIRGLWRGKKITITSISNWVAPGEPGAEADDGGGGMDRFVYLFTSAAYACYVTLCGTIPPTCSEAGLLAWRRWLGPRIHVDHGNDKGKGKGRKTKYTEIVAPSPFRPLRSALLERHVCYGLWSRQYRAGLVEGPIYCVDLRSAYALALAVAPLPLAHCKRLHRPPMIELAECLHDNSAFALVRINTNERAYPARRNGAVFPAIGHYWTWLGGAELAQAVWRHDAVECHTAEVWHEGTVTRPAGKCLMNLSQQLKSAGEHGAASAWRAMYSSLVGRFAARRKVWRDMPPFPGLDRWGEWYHVRWKDGVIEHCRSIAGRQQVLQSREDTSSAVPFLYGSITAMVRTIMAKLAGIAGHENVVAVVADCLWLNQEGWDRVRDRSQAEGLDRDAVQVKDVLSCAWLDGKASAVMESNRGIAVHVPGFPTDSPLGDGEVIEIRAAVPWNQCRSVKAEDGSPCTSRVFDARKFMTRNSQSARVLPIGERLDDILLAQELIDPLPTERKVTDERS